MPTAARGAGWVWTLRGQGYPLCGRPGRELCANPRRFLPPGAADAFGPRDHLQPLLNVRRAVSGCESNDEVKPVGVSLDRRGVVEHLKH